MSEVADGVDSVPAEDFSSGAESAPDPVAELVESVGELVEQVRAHHARVQACERIIDQLHLEVERFSVGEQGQRLAIAVVKADLILDLPPARELRADRVRDWPQEAGLDNLVLAAERDFAEVGTSWWRRFLARGPVSDVPAQPVRLAAGARWPELLPDQSDRTKKTEEAA